MRFQTIYILILIASVASCGKSQSLENHPHFIKLRETSEVVSTQQWRQLADSNDLSDSSSHTTRGVLASICRIVPTINHERSGLSIATFVFDNKQRRCETLSGAASVFTDGIDYAIVDEDQCGTPVRFVKYNREDELIFEKNEYSHAHSRSCFSVSAKLVFIYVFEASEIWVYDWKDGEKIGSLPVLPNEGSKITMAIDMAGHFLYVCLDKDRSLKVRKYPITDLRNKFNASQ